MKWFGGSIPEAIQAAKINSSLLIVYISGDHEMSKQMEEVWADTAVCELCERERCVGLTFTADSEAGKQFGAFYPVVCIPSTYFIGKDGVPLEVVGGHVATREFYKKIQNAVQIYRDLHLSYLEDQRNLKMHKGSPGATTPPADGASTSETSVTPPPAATPTEAQPSPAIPDPTPKSAQPAAPSTTTQPQTSTVSATQDLPASSSEAGEAGARPKETLEERMEKARQVIEEKNRLKAEQEKEDVKRKERERRELGQDLHRFQKMKCDMEADEIKQARLKEKREEKEARERVRKQIAQDKADRAARVQKEKDDRHTEPAAPTVTAPATAPATTTRSETARLQFRLPDGRAVTNQFPSSDTLNTARDFIKPHAASLGSFTLSTTYPKRVFTQADMSQSLLDLNLAPSAVVVVLPGAGPLQSSGGTGGGGLLMTVLAPVMALWGFICSFLFGQPQNPGGAYNPTAPEAAAQPSTASKPTEPKEQQRPGTSRQRPKSSYGLRRRQEGNIHRLSAEEDDDDQTTWNGNSTQQM